MVKYIASEGLDRSRIRVFPFCIILHFYWISRCDTAIKSPLTALNGPGREPTGTDNERAPPPSSFHSRTTNGRNKGDRVGKETVDERRGEERKGIREEKRREEIFPRVLIPQYTRATTELVSRPTRDSRETDREFLSSSPCSSPHLGFLSVRCSSTASIAAATLTTRGRGRGRAKTPAINFKASRSAERWVRSKGNFI